jgi:hypothetical protein
VPRILRSLLTPAFRTFCGSALLPIGLLLVPTATTAVPFVPDFSAGPVVFDFEDGLQGWTASGSVERLATDALDGEWALFGNGLVLTGVNVGGIIIGTYDNAISIDIDLTGVGWLELDQLYLGDPATGTDFIGVLERFELIPAIFIGKFVPLSGPDPLANPGTRRLSLHGHTGVETLTLGWGCYVCPDPADLPPDTSPLASGLIDSITLYSIPEPTTALLLACGLAGLGVPRRLH